MDATEGFRAMQGLSGVAWRAKSTEEEKVAGTVSLQSAPGGLCSSPDICTGVVDGGAGLWMAEHARSPVDSRCVSNIAHCGSCTVLSAALNKPPTFTKLQDFQFS